MGDGEDLSSAQFARRVQHAHGITPRTVKSAIESVLEDEVAAHELAAEGSRQQDDYVTEEYMEELQKEMLSAAENLELSEPRPCGTRSTN